MCLHLFYKIERTRRKLLRRLHRWSKARSFIFAARISEINPAFLQRYRFVSHSAFRFNREKEISVVSIKRRHDISLVARFVRRDDGNAVDNIIAGSATAGETSGSSYDQDKTGVVGVRGSSSGRDVPIATARRSNATEQPGVTQRSPGATQRRGSSR